jgi:hypothetical protein
MPFAFPTVLPTLEREKPALLRKTFLIGALNRRLFLSDPRNGAADAIDGAADAIGLKVSTCGQPYRRTKRVTHAINSELEAVLGAGFPNTLPIIILHRQQRSVAVVQFRSV